MRGLHHVPVWRITGLLLVVLAFGGRLAVAQEFRPLADLAAQGEKARGLSDAESVPGELPQIESVEMEPQADADAVPESIPTEMQQLREELERQRVLIDQLTERAATWEEQWGDGDLELLDRVAQIESGLVSAQDSQRSFLEAFSTEALRQVNGRIHIDHWSFPESSPGVNVMENGNPDIDPQDRLLYRRLRIGVGGQVPPLNMSYRIEIEFSGQDGSRFRDAWIGWDDLPLLNTVRVGNQKRPYGWDQLNSSNFMVFLERPFVDEAFNMDARRFGLASYGGTEDQVFNWQYGIYSLPEIQNSGQSVSDVLQGEFAWRLGNTWWYDESSDGRGYGYWGLAGTFAFPDGDGTNAGGPPNQARFQTRPEGRSSDTWLDTDVIEGANAYQILGLETVFNVGPLQLAGEFMNLWLQRQGGSAEDVHLHGAYVYASYFITGEHLTWNRQLGILGRTSPFEDFFHVDTCRGGAPWESGPGRSPSGPRTPTSTARTSSAGSVRT